MVPSDSSYGPGQHLSFGDIAVDNQANPSYLRVKQLKTGPFRNGVKIIVRCAEGPLCPVAAVLAYMALRGPGEGQLFRFQDGRFFFFLTQQRLVTKLREVLQEVGLHPEKYAGHSFRIGAATTAGACGVHDSLIKTMGRWESVAYKLYAMCGLLRSSLQQWQLLLLECVRHSLNGTLVFFTYYNVSDMRLLV